VCHDQPAHTGADDDDVGTGRAHGARRRGGHRADSSGARHSCTVRTRSVSTAVGVHGHAVAEVEDVRPRASASRAACAARRRTSSGRTGVRGRDCPAR
jgi:hypothetical protein